MSNVKDSSCEFSMLTLSEATKAGQLQDFIDEEEAHDTGPVDRNKVDKALGWVLRTHQSRRRTHDGGFKEPTLPLPRPQRR